MATHREFLPLLLVLVSVWGWSSGHDALALPAVLAASFVVQTHGSYLLIGPALLAAAVACRYANRRLVAVRRRPLLLAAGAGALVWLQPIGDQLFGTRNMWAIASRASSDGDQTLGFANGVRAAAMVLVKPPWWTRSGVSTALPNGGGFVNDDRGRVFDPDWLSFPVAAGGMAVIVGVLVACALVARRRGDQVVIAGAMIGVVVVVVAVLSLARLPVDAFGFTAHKARWLWPIGAYITAFVFTTLLRFEIPRNHRQAVVSVCLVGGITVAATLPTSYQLVSPAQYEVGSQAVARELRDAVGALEGRGVVFLDLSRRSFPDPYNDTVAAEMAARGISFRVAGEYLVGQYGEQRRLDVASGVDVTVRIFVGSEAAGIPAAWDVVTKFLDGTRSVILAVREGLVLGPSAPTG